MDLTKKNFYLDIYSLPEIDFQEKIRKGIPLSTLEFNNIIERVYRILSNNNFENDLNNILLISKPCLIINISNFIRLSILKSKLECDFNIVVTSKESFNYLAGERNLGKGYLADFFSDSSYPIIQPFLRGYFYNKKKEYIKELLSIFPNKNKSVIFNANKWVEGFLDQKNIRYTKLFNSYFWKMKENPNINKNKKSDTRIEQLSWLLVNDITKEFYNNIEFNEERLKNIILNILSQSYTDYINCKDYVENKKIFFDEIYSGTCGSYLTRIVFSVLKDKGVITNGFMHSGSIAHLNYSFDPRLYIEYEMPNNFYLFNNDDINVIKKTLEKYEIKTKLMSMGLVSQKIDKKSETLLASNRKKIVYVATNTLGGFQFFGVDDDLRKASYENRLFEILDEMGCFIKYKSHPKGIKQNYSLLTKKFRNLEIIENQSMPQMINSDNEIFIFKMVDSTAFNEVMRSNKPAIVVSENQETLFSEEARKAVSNRVSFVDCYYDENGLAVINESQLEEALNREYIMDFDFVNRFQ